MRNIIRALPQGRGPLSFPCEASRLVPIGSPLGAPVHSLLARGRALRAAARSMILSVPVWRWLRQHAPTPFAWGFVIIGVVLGLFLTLVLGPRSQAH